MKANGVDDEKYPPKQVGWFINNCKESGLRPGDVEVNDEFNRKYVQLYQLYQDQCEREGVVDFAELLLRTYEVLLKNIPLRTHYQHRFSHILIDEFQDTNTLQYAWLRLLAGQGEYMSDIDRTRAAESKRIAVANIFAVGDDDQSIYAFRGANVGNMDSLVRDFQVRNLIKLEQNYRSHGHILNSANALIKNNAKRLGKELWTDAGVGEQVRVFEAPSDLAEAQFVLEEVGGLTRDGWPRSQCAILYRSNAQSRAFEQGLMRHGIPYRVYGGLRFFERADCAGSESAHARHWRPFGRAAAGHGARTRYIAVRGGGLSCGQGGHEHRRLREADRRHALCHAGPAASRDRRAHHRRQRPAGHVSR